MKREAEAAKKRLTVEPKIEISPSGIPRIKEGDGVYSTSSYFSLTEGHDREHPELDPYNQDALKRPML